MRAVSPSRVLIVAHQTADSPELVAAVTRRAAQSHCTFTLLVPAAAHGPHDHAQAPGHAAAEAERRLERAIPLLSQAAGEPIVGVLGSSEPLAAVRDALNLLGFDEVIISMLPVRESGWLHLGLPRKVRALGVPVTEVITSARAVGSSTA